jgi:RNA polymerase sigma-70 factor (ECF subfamily)
VTRGLQECSPRVCRLRDVIGHHTYVDGDTENIVRNLRPLILRYCRARMPGQYDSADDVTQEVCIALLAALPRYRDMGCGLPAFAYGIASHKVADALRASARRAMPMAELPEPPDRAQSPEDAILDRERARDLLRALPPQLRKLVTLRVLDGWTAEQTGEALGMTPGAVRVAQHRAMGRLRSVAAPVQ